jgi:hypothetical protein
MGMFWSIVNWGKITFEVDSVAGEIIDGYRLDQIHSLSMYVDVLDPVCSLNSWCLVVEFDLESSHVFHMTHMFVVVSFVACCPHCSQSPNPHDWDHQHRGFRQGSTRIPRLRRGCRGIKRRGIWWDTFTMGFITLYNYAM